MKYEFIFELLKNIKQNPKLFRKIKIAVVVLFFGFILLGGLTIWTGIKMVNYLGLKTTEIVKPLETMNAENILPASLNSVTKIQLLSCWDSGKSLLAIRPWIDRSVFDNLVFLKEQCFKNTENNCQGEECTKNENQPIPLKGRIL
jgi:hypothetical protein